jgi:hypothetical protein
MRLFLGSGVAVALLAGCALDMNGLGPDPTQHQDDAGAELHADAVAPPSTPSAATSNEADAGPSLYGKDQNAAQLACAPSCNGCCDRSGTCHIGNETAVCGQSGLACVDCTPGGFYCNATGFCDWDGGR